MAVKFKSASKQTSVKLLLVKTRALTFDLTK